CDPDPEPAGRPDRSDCGTERQSCAETGPSRLCHGQRPDHPVRNRQRIAATPGNPRRLSGGRPAGAVALPPPWRALRQDAANGPWICPKFADDFVVKSADNRPDFGTRPAGCFLKSTDLRGYLMTSLKLIGLALSASLALSTTALAQDIAIAVAGPVTGGESAL